MDLDEFAIGIIDALLKDRRLRRTCADYGVGALAEDGADAPGGQDRRFSREGAEFHRAEIQRRDAARDALRVDDGREKLPALVLLDLAFRLIAAHLLIESVEELLAGGRSRKGGAVIEGAPEPAEIQEAFRGAVEGDTHAIEEVDDPRSCLTHRFDRRLIG